MNKHDASMTIAEESRDTTKHTGILANLAQGILNAEGCIPFPERSAEDIQNSLPVLTQLETFLRTQVDPDEIDKTGEIPDEIIQALRSMGAFGIKIPKHYKGLGLSQSGYANLAQLLGSWDASLTALISANNSIGLPEPLKQFGTDEQKAYFLPRVARGKITAFGLTESQAGSDLSRMKTIAIRMRDDNEKLTGYRITGEKIWTTNATKNDDDFLAEYLVVIARIVDRENEPINEDTPFGAFIVSTNLHGMNVEQRCDFMGLKALYSGHITFNRVEIPLFNRLGNEGQGISIALSSLAIGRLTLPAACVGGMKQVLSVTRWWTNKRIQWFNRRIADHGLISRMLVDVAAHTFALEAATTLTCRWVDQGRDVRLESAACKLMGSEWLGKAVDDGFQARSGRAYEKPESLLKRHGEVPIPFERWMRDARINRIFEGTTEMMLLWIAREILEPYKHMSEASLLEKPQAAAFLLHSFPKCNTQGDTSGIASALQEHINFVAHEAFALRNIILRAGIKFGGRLQVMQCELAELTRTACDLFAITAVCSYATHLNDEDHPHIIDLANYFCWEARNRIEPLSLKKRVLNYPNSKRRYKLAQRIANGEMMWLEEGIISLLQHFDIEDS